MISRDCTHQNFRVNYFLKEEPDPNNFVIQRHFTRSLFHMSTFWNPIPGIGWNVIRSLESGDISPDPKSRWADCISIFKWSDLLWEKKSKNFDGLIFKTTYRETLTLHLHEIFHEISHNTNLTILTQMKSKGGVLLFTKPLLILFLFIPAFVLQGVWIENYQKLKALEPYIDKAKMRVKLKQVTNNELDQNSYSYIRLFLRGIDIIESMPTNSLTLWSSDDLLLLYFDSKLS